MLAAPCPPAPHPPADKVRSVAATRSLISMRDNSGSINSTELMHSSSGAGRPPPGDAVATLCPAPGLALGDKSPTPWGGGKEPSSEIMAIATAPACRAASRASLNARACSVVMPSSTRTVAMECWRRRTSASVKPRHDARTDVDMLTVQHRYQTRYVHECHGCAWKYRTWQPPAQPKTGDTSSKRCATCARNTDTPAPCLPPTLTTPCAILGISVPAAPSLSWTPAPSAASGLRSAESTRLQMSSSTLRRDSSWMLVCSSSVL
mmetsp:Transcript_72501/g.106255  ORF Transcript_72501/g.106255 Transcript_72501/m.106255 type:complete len:263 (+) Transcript_72501:354-1142(+)